MEFTGKYFFTQTNEDQKQKQSRQLLWKQDGVTQTETYTTVTWFQ